MRKTHNEEKKIEHNHFSNRNINDDHHTYG